MIIRTLLPILLFFQNFCMASELHLVVNAPNSATLPKNFRTYDATYTMENGEKKQVTLAVSSQFSESSLKEVIRAYPSKKIEVINVRQEPYVFIDGMACEAKSHDVDHATLACMIPRNKPIAIHDMSTKKYVEMDGKQVKIEIPGEKKEYLPCSVCTEEELVKSFGLKYTHLAIENNKADHSRQEIATHETIDRMVETLKKSFEESDIIYVHCKAGKSRSPSIVVLALMLMLSDDINLEAFEAAFEKSTYEHRKFQQHKKSFYMPFFEFLRSKEAAKTRFSAHFLHHSACRREEVSK